jgi:hypothetical protein
MYLLDEVCLFAVLFSLSLAYILDVVQGKRVTGSTKKAATQGCPYPESPENEVRNQR